MNKNKITCSIILTIVFVFSYVHAQNVSFIPAGQNTAYGKYNTVVTNSSTAAGDGGFTMSGNTLAIGTLYRIEVSFDGGSTWYYQFSSMTASTGSAYSNGRFESDGSGDAVVSVNHDVFSALSAWPGNDGTIRLRVKDTDNNTYYPGSTGTQWILDLTRPSISTASIASNNGTSTAYATSSNTITLTITASEDLSNTAPYDFAGNISGLDFNASQGSDATEWTIFNTVTTHAEGVATFEVTYYDENYNVGATTLQSTTDGSTVTIDKTSPEMTVTIASNNDVTSLAKHGDVVTVSISANENLFEAPDVGIAANTNATVNPTTSSSTYSATHTMNQASDPQTAVSLSVAGIKDFAGNTVSTITATTNASSVTFDYTAPTLTSVSSASNNSLTTSRAKADDVVTITFFSNEQIQTPVVLIESESSLETNGPGDKTSWTATKTMDADDADGAVDFTINFTDLAGNAGTEVDVSGLTSGGVTFDNTAPATSSVTVTSSNTNSGFAISGDVVSVTIVANEDLQGDESLNPYGITSASIAARPVTGTDISKISATNWKLSTELNGSEDSGPTAYSFVMTDLTGNQATISSDISDITIDNTAPSLSSVSIASVSTDDAAYAKAGDDIRVTFTASENLSTSTAPTGTIASSAASVAAVGGSQTEYTSTLTTNSSTTEGAVAFTLAFQDPAGNTASASATTDGTSVIFDRTVPLMSYVTMASDNGNPIYAKVGSLVTLSFKATDRLKGTPVVTMATNAATESGSNADSVWTAIYTMTNTDSEGEIPFTLDFTDLAGNDGTRVTSVSNDNDGVVIFDRTAPSLTTVSISSNNSNGTTLAKVGDVITLTIVSSENIQTPTAVIAGRTDDDAASLTDNTTGQALYTSTYTMQSGDTEGAVAFTIDYFDLANNPGTQATALINDADGSGITFDKTAPTFTAVTIASDNSIDDAAAKVGDEITIELTASEAIKTGADPTITINGNTASVTRNNSTSFTATYTMSTTDIPDPADNIAAIPFSVSNYQDVVGNAGADVTSTTDGSSVKFDPVAPTLSNVAMVSVNTSNSAYAKEGDVIRLTFSSSETINTPTISMLGSTADVTITQPQANSWQAEKTVTGSHAESAVAFSVNFSDLIGNTGDNGSGGSVVSTLSGDNSLVTVDRTTPSITTVDIASSNSIDDQFAGIGDVVTLTFITDEAIQTPAVTLHGNAAPTITAVDGFANTKWTAVITASGNNEGIIEFLIDFTDLASNDGVDQTSILNDTDGDGVTYDNSKPELQSVNLVSDNSINTAYGKVGSSLVLTFSSDEQLLSTDNNLDVRMWVQDSATYKRIATLENTATWNGSTEGWTATVEIPDSWNDNEGAGRNVEYSIQYRDLFTTAGDMVTHQTPVIVSGGVTFDRTGPTIPVLTYASNNSNLATRAKVGDDINVTINGSEPLANVTLTVEGANTTETSVGGTLDSNWTATYTMLDGDAEGSVDVNLDYKDFAGNSGATKTSTTDGVTITFDKTTPTLSSVSIASNNRYDTSKAKAGDEITVSFTATENLKSSPVVTIATKAATVTQGANPSVWAATYTMTADDNTDGAAIAFTVDFSDLAANAGVQVVATTEGSSVIFDKTAVDLTDIGQPDLDNASDSGVSNSDNLTNDTTPSFTFTGLTGVGATNDTLILFIDNTRMDSARVTGNSLTLTVPDANALAHATTAYSVKVKSRDLTGNISDFSGGLDLIIDTQAPAVGDALDLLVDDDSGFSDSDNITNATTPQLKVAGLIPVADPATAVYDSVRIYQDVAGLSVTDQFLEGFILDGTGVSKTHELTADLLEDVYNFSYKVVDAAGNISAMSGGLEVTIDLTPPSATAAPDLLDAFDSGTSNSDDLTNLTTVDIRVTGLTIGDKVYLVNTANSDSIITSEVVAATQTDLTIESLISGTFATQVEDPTGNKSINSDVLTITVDTDAPNLIPESDPVVIDLADASDTGLATDDNITKETLPTFNLTNVTVTDSIFLYRTVAGQADELIAKNIATGTSISFTTGGDKEFTENNFSIKAKAKDYAGNLSEFSNELAIIVDTTPFTTSSAPDLVDGSDTGVSSSDNITSTRRPTFNISQLAEAADFVELFKTDTLTNASELVASGTKLATGTTLQLDISSDLTSGTYNFQYRVTELAGNISALSSGTIVTIDYTTPSAPSDLDLVSSKDFGVSDSDNLTNATTLSITSSGFITGEYGLLYQDGDTPTLLETVLLDESDSGVATFSVTNDVSGVDSETFNYFVLAQDAAGNVTTKGVSPTLSVEVDQVAPIVTGAAFTLAAESYTGIPENGNSSDTTPEFTVENTGIDFELNDSLIVFYALKPISQNSGSGLNGVAKRFASLLVDNATTETFVGTGFDENGDGTLDDGAYSITIKVKDRAGNLSEASPEFIYRLDTTTPTADLSAPDLLAEDDTGYDSNDNITQNTEPRFLITGLEAYKKDKITISGLRGFTTTELVSGFADDDPPIDTLTVPSDKALAEGSWTITYTVEDSAGNITSSSTALSITVDVTAPSAPVLPDLQTAFDKGISNNDNLTNLSDLRITYKGIEVGDIGELYLDDGNGVYDAADGVDTKLNSALLSADADGDGVADSLFVDVTSLPEGDNVFYSTAIDAAGNQSNASASVLTVTIDKTAPIVAGYTLALDPGSDTGIADDGASSITTPTFTITPAEDNSDDFENGDSLIVYYALNPISQNGSDLVGVEKRFSTLLIDDTDSEIFTGAGFDENGDGTLDDGSYSIIVKARDNAGNLSIASPAFVYRLDRVAPTANLSAPDLVAIDDTGFDNTDNITNKRAPSFLITGLDPYKQDSVALYAQKGFTNYFAVADVGANDPPEVTLTVPWVDGGAQNGNIDDGEGFGLEEGSWTITYTVKDSAGNISEVSSSLSMVVDITAPTVPALADLNSAFDTGVSQSDNLTKLTDLKIALKGIDEDDIGELYLDDGDGVFDGGLGDNPVDTKIDSVLLFADADGDGNQDSLFFDATGIAGAINSFYTTATDAAGNQSAASVALEVIIDQVAPDLSGVTVDLKNTSDTGEFDDDNISKNDAPVFSITGLVAPIGAQTDSLFLYFNGTDSVNVVATTDAEEITGLLAADGTYPVTLKARDYAGNLSDAVSGNVPVEYTLDRIAPVGYDPNNEGAEIAFSAPDLIPESDTGFDDTDNITNQLNPTFRISNLNPFETNKIVIYSQRLFITTPLDSSNSINFQSTVDIAVPALDSDGNDLELQEGTQDISYTVRDLAGNITEFSPTLEVICDTLPPAALGTPDLPDNFDTGELIDDDLTNLNTIQINQTQTISGNKWNLFSFTDVDPDDGGYDPDVDGASTLEDTQLSPNGDVDNTGIDSDGDGILDTTRTLSIEIDVANPQVYSYYAVQEDTAGNLSELSQTLSITVDSAPPTCLVTTDWDQNRLVNSDSVVVATFTFSESLDDETLPVINVLYDGDSDANGDNIVDDGPIAIPVTLTKGGNDGTSDIIWTASIPLNNSDIIAYDGTPTIEVVASDVYGNAVQESDVTFQRTLRIDNTPALFSQFSPGDVSFNNGVAMQAFSWLLDDPNESTNIISCSVTFNNLDDLSTYTTDLLGPDLIEGARDEAPFPGWNIDYTLTEGKYDIIFTSLDNAGNTGIDTIQSVTYDLTQPTVDLSFSRLYASDGDTVTITATFSERMDVNSPPVFSMDLPGGIYSTTGPMELIFAPETFIDGGYDDDVDSDDTGNNDGEWTWVDINNDGIWNTGEGESFTDLNGDGIWNQGDSTLWKYVYILGFDGEPTLLDGDVSNIQISDASDLANNDLADPINIPDIDGDGSADLLNFDNIDGTATFTYENITNPALTNVGIGGDTIRVTVSTSEEILDANPVPSLTLKYNRLNPGVGDSTFLNLNTIVNPNTWVFEFVISDSSNNDGFINFKFNGNDYAENPVQTFINNNDFAVDNLPPTSGSTGIVKVYGGNPIQGYITANTTEIGVNIDVPSFESDSTLEEGGLVEIQFRNKTRGPSPPTGWKQIGTNSDIQINGQEVEFTRPIEDLYSVMDTTQTNNTGLQPGDSLYVRVRVIDKHANITAWDVSETKLVYDPYGPVPGEIISGNFTYNTNLGILDTIISSDLVNIGWSSFYEQSITESGVERYEISINKKFEANGELELFYGPDTLGLSDTVFSQILSLEHDTRYIAEIVAYDSAGNVSQTVVSDTLLRYNSKPIISTISSASIEEDTFWSYTVETDDLDFNVLQGDSHIFTITSNIPVDSSISEGVARGGTNLGIFLAAEDVIQDDYYNGNIITITAPSGGPQTRTILDYHGGTRFATISTGLTDWENNPTNSGTTYNIFMSSIVIDSTNGTMTWTPTQVDLGQYDITVTVSDLYGLFSTQSFSIGVTPVNDVPGLFLSDSVLVSGEQIGTFVWDEDTDSAVTLILSDYAYDVDNNIANELDWSVVLYDVSQLDEDYPVGQVIFGPNTSMDFRARLMREFMGFDINNGAIGLSSETIQLINSTRDNPFIDVSIVEDGTNETVVATFTSVENYHGSDMRAEIIVDNFGLEARDTIIINILPENDPPTIAALPDTFVYENNEIWLDFGIYTTDIDDTSLTFTVTALTNEEKLKIGDNTGVFYDPFEFVSFGLFDTVRFLPDPLWSNEHQILVRVADEDTSVTDTFLLDIERVMRPHLSVSVTQNNAFSNFLQVMVLDTLSKTTYLSMEVQNQPVILDTVAAYTYTGDVTFDASGSYSIDIFANASVGDTTVSESFALVAGKTGSRWMGRSSDGQFSVAGDPGSILYDQPFLIADSTLFEEGFHDKASYVLGSEGFKFKQPVEIRIHNDRDDLAIYRRKNSVTWEELPSLTKEGEIFTLSSESGYFKLGPKTLIVPEQTNIYQNYPNPFNPTTTVMYDIGLMDGLSQNVSINIYNLLGQHIRTLVENKDQIGQFKVQWDGYDQFGQQMSSGVYFIQLLTKSGIVKNKKMMLLK